MKIDLVGPAQRGLAMGLNESAGYLAGLTAAAFGVHAATRLVAVLTFASGLVAAVRMIETAAATGQ
jgi:hypothetical protein